MVKQIYNKSDGKPSLIYLNSEGVFEFDEFIYTEVIPPSDIYEPKYFDGDQWVGATREEWLESLPEEEPQLPDQSILQMAQTQMQVAESSYQLRDTQKQLANSMLEIAEKDKRVDQLEKQQAEIMLELAEIKGGK